MLVGVAAVISMIAFMLFIGKGMEYGASSSLKDIDDSISYDYVVSLANSSSDNEMPAVTAYNILTKFSDYITWSVNLTVPDNVEDSQACRSARTEGDPNKDYICSGIKNVQLHGSDLSNNLKGRVQLEIIDRDNGTFLAVIHPQDSTWRSGVATYTNKQYSWYTSTIRDLGMTATWRNH